MTNQAVSRQIANELMRLTVRCEILWRPRELDLIAEAIEKLLPPLFTPQAMGRQGGKAGKGRTSEAKAAAARANGKKGGRPKKSTTQENVMTQIKKVPYIDITEEVCDMCGEFGSESNPVGICGQCGIPVCKKCNSNYEVGDECHHA